MFWCKQYLFIPHKNVQLIFIISYSWTYIYVWNDIYFAIKEVNEREKIICYQEGALAFARATM
jgi:hypothetical protein